MSGRTVGRGIREIERQYHDGCIGICVVVTES
jgi:hypothetical protein